MAKGKKVWQSTQTFLLDGNRWVRVGDTVVDGHPVLKGNRAKFIPWEPTFGSLEDEPEPAPEPVKAEAAP